MKALLLFLAAALLGQLPSKPGVYRMADNIPDIGEVRYALALPEGYSPRQPRPLVVALHPGGQRFPYYGGAFMEQVVGPGLADLDAIILAPDCPTGSWTDANAERAVMTLVREVMNKYSVDSRRVVVAGFSMGGRGTWYMASRHTDLFSAAIVMAGAPGNLQIDRLATRPTYVIHSRDDEVVEFEPTEKTVKELQRLGRTIEFEPLEGVGHFNMTMYVDPLSRAGEWVSEQWKNLPR